MLEIYVERALSELPPAGLTGRKKIRLPYRVIDETNIEEALGHALAVHHINAGEITYLYNYYKGSQDIQNKVKLQRENINNKVTVNRAEQIVTFDSAYLLSEPIQYVTHSDDPTAMDEVAQLNEYRRMMDMSTRDKEIIDWTLICGVAERLTLRNPNPDWRIDGEAPAVVYTLDPRQAFVIYSSAIGERPLLGVVIQSDESGNPYITAYNDTHKIVVTQDGIVSSEPHLYRSIPLTEYVANTPRMACFEGVLSILNNINVLESNAVDAIQDFVNGFDVFQNCKIEDSDYSQLSLGGKAVNIATVVQGSEARVYRIASELNQNYVQQRIDDLTDAYTEICGLPNRNGGSSTSDTGTAVLFRDGWDTADSLARGREVFFKASEKLFGKVLLQICYDYGGQALGDLKISDYEVKFPRGHLANLQSKVQVLCEMLNNPKLAPKYAFQLCGLFEDPEEANRESAEYYAKFLDHQVELLNAGLDSSDTTGKDADGVPDGSSSS